MSKTPMDTGSVLCWPKKVLSADDLRRHLTNQRELQLLPRTIITPLAMDELKAKGVRISSQVSPEVMCSEPLGCGAVTWFYAQGKPDTMLSAAIAGLAQDGILLTAYEIKQQPWIIAFAEMLVASNVGGVALVAEPGLICCLANKLSGVRAVSVESVANIKGVKKLLGPNLFAIATQGCTFFELKQMLRTIASSGPQCPAEIATSLQELDGHAHR